MAYCPKCENNYSIVTSTKGSFVPVITDRYNSEDDYIGYEIGSGVDIKTLPRCSNCYSVFEFPNVTSKGEFFYARRNDLLEIWRKRKPDDEVSMVTSVICVAILIRLTAK